LLNPRPECSQLDKSQKNENEDDCHWKSKARQTDAPEEVMPAIYETGAFWLEFFHQGEK